MTKALTIFNNKSYLLLLLICLVALVLRVYKINELPLYGDELTIAYDAYSLLETGRDSTGESLPLTFKMGEGRPAGYVYFSIPFIAVFGTSAYGVRMLSLLSGLGIIVAVYLIGKGLFSRRIGFIAAALTAISPWSLSLSRGGFESHFALFLALAGVFAFLNIHKNNKYLILWAFAWGIAIHTYPTYKLVLPVFFVIMLLYKNSYKNLIVRKNRALVAVSVIILLIFSLFSLNETIYGVSEARFTRLNIFSDEIVREQIVQKVNYERSLSTLPGTMQFLVHNKFVEFAKLLLSSYFANFSPDFLVIAGDENPRHNMTAMGQLFWVVYLLVFIGLLYMFSKRKQEFKLLILWLLAAPLATTFLNDPHALRNSFMLPPIILIASYGLNEIRKKHKIGFVVMFSILIFQLILILYNLYFISPKKYARFWDYSAKQAVGIAESESDEFDYVIVSTSIEAVEHAFPVYLNIDPKIPQESITINDYLFRKYNNILVGDLSDEDLNKVRINLEGNVLYIGDYENDRNSLEEYKTVYSADTLPSLVIKEFN